MLGQEHPTTRDSDRATSPKRDSDQRESVSGLRWSRRGKFGSGERMYPRAVAMLLLGVVVLVVAAVFLGTWITSTSSAGSVSSVAQVDVNASVKVAPVGDIVGSVINENYFGPSHPVHPDWNHSYLGRTVNQVRQLAPVDGRKFAVRFGQSTTDGWWGNDGYHWVNALDPHQWSTSIDSFLEYASRVQGDPYVAVNFGSGTAQEAAAFVAYTNGTDTTNPNVQMRLKSGRTSPYGVRNWIIGFEEYGQWETGYYTNRPYDYGNPRAANGGDPEWYNKPSANPDFFAARAAEYVRAMRAASPTPIRIYVPVNNWDLGYWGGPEPSVKALMTQLGGSVDGVSIHFYPENDPYGVTDEDLLGRTETLADKLDLLRRLLAQYGPSGKTLDIADVEYNNDSGTNQQTHQLINGLFVADTLRVLATKGVTSAFYFAISAPEGNQSGFTYFENGDVNRPMPTYLATQLVASNLGDEVVDSQIVRSKIITAPGGTMGSFNYPALTSLASLSPDRKTLYLIVINKDLGDDQPATIRLHDVDVTGPVELTELNGASPHAEAGQVSLRHLTASFGKTVSYTFPAHSVTAMRFHLANPVP